MAAGSMQKAAITTVSVAGITAIAAVVLQRAAMLHRSATSRHRGSGLRARRATQAHTRIVRKRELRVLYPCGEANLAMGLI